MKRSIVISVFILFALMLFVIPDVLSIGISARREIDFAPALEDNFSFCVIPEKNGRISLNLEGELSEYMTLPLTEKEYSVGGSECFAYHVKLPNILSPGPHVGYVVASDEPYGEGKIKVVTSVRHEFRVHVPYPGRYIEFTTSAKDVQINETVPFNLNLQNKGKETITEVSGRVDIFGPDGKYVASLETDKLSNFEPQTKAETHAEWDTTGHEPGPYTYAATITYDGSIGKKESSFLVGVIDLDIINTTTKIYKGTVNPFEITVRSKWNMEMKGVYADVRLPNATVRTPTIDLLPKETKGLYTFVDAANLGVGNYSAQVEVFFEGNSRLKNLTLVVEELPSQGSIIDTKLIVIGLLILVAIILLTVNIIYMIRRRKEK